MRPKACCVGVIERKVGEPPVPRSGAETAASTPETLNVAVRIPDALGWNRMVIPQENPLEIDAPAHASSTTVKSEACGPEISTEREPVGRGLAFRMRSPRVGEAIPRRMSPKSSPSGDALMVV